MSNFLKGSLVVILFSSSTLVFSQVLGDYQSVAIVGNWSDLNSWERWNGAAWATPTALEGYPGELFLPATVTIQIINFIRWM